jgi:hypothetical protein
MHTLGCYEPENITTFIFKELGLNTEKGPLNGSFWSDVQKEF